MVFWLSCVNNRSALRNPDVRSVLILLESIFDDICVFCESERGIVTGGRVRRGQQDVSTKLIVTAPCIERILDAFKAGNAPAAISVGRSGCRCDIRKSAQISACRDSVYESFRFESCCDDEKQKGERVAPDRWEQRHPRCEAPEAHASRATHSHAAENCE
jgi:hypothetical protein